MSKGPIFSIFPFGSPGEEEVEKEKRDEPSALEEEEMDESCDLPGMVKPVIQFTQSSLLSDIVQMRSKE